MVWQKYQQGYQLLAKVNMRTQKRDYLGRRSEKTEKIASDFLNSKKQLKNV